MEESKIIVYQSDDGQTLLDVKLERDTVWLTANQMALLFGRDEKTLRKHINNVFMEQELLKENNTQILRVVGVKQPVAFYSLDVIISVGYRVKSRQGTQFRVWANKIIKDYLLKGYVVQQRIEHLEHRVLTLETKQEAFDLAIKTSLPSSEGLFFDGQIYDAFECVRNIIKTAEESILLIDNYVDESVLTMMSDKKKDVEVKVYTARISSTLQLAAQKFNLQYGKLEIKNVQNFHDRFLIIDKAKIYLIGASLKDLGKKWFGFIEMDSSNITKIIGALP